MRAVGQCRIDPRSTLSITGESSMQKSSAIALMVASAVGATLALPLIANAGPAPMPSFTAEKCYGVAVAGKNDCAATGSHSCAGEGKMANDPKSWIYVPTGTCQKITGASLMPKA
jgi:uncharacterized membrane protein